MLGLERSARFIDQLNYFPGRARASDCPEQEKTALVHVALVVAGVPHTLDAYVSVVRMLIQVAG
jgi:hypothetical protein